MREHFVNYYQESIDNLLVLVGKYSESECAEVWAKSIVKYVAKKSCELVTVKPHVHSVIVTCEAALRIHFLATLALWAHRSLWRLCLLLYRCLSQAQFKDKSWDPVAA